MRQSDYFEDVFVTYTIVNISWSIQYRTWWSPIFCSIKCLYVPSSVLWCPLPFPHKTMFGLSLPLVVCRRAHVLYTSFVFVCLKWCPTHIVLCFFCFFFVLWIVLSWLPLLFSLTSMELSMLNWINVILLL